MGKPTGFLEVHRRVPALRPAQERTQDYRELGAPQAAEALREQSARCMDCGVPFCHQGCPLGNLIPDWNDAHYHDDLRRAYTRLAATNNFPEFTGRVCPAPCEAACVLGLRNESVTIKAVEVDIAERAWRSGLVRPRIPRRRSGKRVAVVGSGPAGLAAADQLNQLGHTVTVLERADRVGGLLRYGIPDFKLDKSILDRRLDLMATEGVEFCTHAAVDGTRLAALRRQHHAVLLATGATVPRDLAVSGRELTGVHFAMDYLSQQNRRCAGEAEETNAGARLTAAGKRVVILGGGDTGADCLGTAHRQGARSVHQLELHPEPPPQRAADNPWPQWPRIQRSAPAHEEGGERIFAVRTVALLGDAQGAVRGLQADDLAHPGEALELDCELVLLAMGFLGPEYAPMQALGLRQTERHTLWRDAQWMTSVPGVFVAGDAQRGQSLIVWAMSDGRSAARGIDAYIEGQSSLSAPV